MWLIKFLKINIKLNTTHQDLSIKMNYKIKLVMKTKEIAFESFIHQIRCCRVIVVFVVGIATSRRFLVVIWLLNLLNLTSDVACAAAGCEPAGG